MTGLLVDTPAAQPGGWARVPRVHGRTWRRTYGDGLVGVVVEYPRPGRPIVTWAVFRDGDDAIEWRTARDADTAMRRCDQAAGVSRC